MLKKEFPYYPNSVKQNMTLLLLWDFLSRWWPILFVILMIFFSLQAGKINWTPLFFFFYLWARYCFLATQSWCYIRLHDITLITKET